jgi:tetratricopeptide (TPR) repeat protein
MTGIRERSNLSREATGLGAIDLHSAVTEHLDTTNSSDPNESYELRDMIAVATTYLRKGQIDDAEDLLLEAIAAGYTRADARELQEAIRDERGQAPPNPPELSHILDPRRQQITQFTQPLPGIEQQSFEIQRAIRETDADLAAGRLLSAYDGSLYTVAMSPTYFPMYVRIAELRLALGDPEGASDLVESIRRCVQLRGQDDAWILLPIRVALDPDDLDALVQYARHLLDQPGSIAREPYVPDAIERTLAVDSAVAFELADGYLRTRPDDDSVLRLYLRAAGSSTDPRKAAEALRRLVRAESSADLLFLRAAIASEDGLDAWLDWLELTVARLVAHPDEWQRAQDVVQLAAQFMPARRAALSSAVAQATMRQVAKVEAALTRWSEATPSAPADMRESLIAACARALALFEARQPAAIDALVTAVEEAVVIDVESFAETCTLFGRSIAPAALLQYLVELASEGGHQQAAALRVQQLRDRFPEKLEIRSALADLYVSANRIPEGVRELRHIAERYEQAGDVGRMVDAMRRISDAIPTNAEAKAKLIDGYLQRGVLDEALRELELLGELHVKRGKHAEAVSAFVRGAEVAAALGSFKRATDMFDRAVAVESDNVAIRHAAVAYLLQTGEIDRAAQQLWEVVRITLREQDPDEAVAALHQIIGLTPTDAHAYHKLGEVLASLGEYAQAERVYRRLAVLTPNDHVLAAKQSALAVLATGN